MPIAIKIIERLKGDKFNLSMYIFVNISSFCILPLSLIALRTTFNSLINVEFITYPKELSAPPSPKVSIYTAPPFLTEHVFVNKQFSIIISSDSFIPTAPAVL